MQTIFNLHELGLIAQSTWETIYMVFIATVVAVIGGIILGILLYVTQDSKNLLIKGFNKSFSIVINITRSIPYIILLILLYPLTRLIVGTTIGTTASIVPLAIAALPFYARLTESALREVDSGLIEAAKSMGATRCQIIFKVLLPESKALLIDAATLTCISLIGFSAMAGIVGGGGLGDLTYFKGYNYGNYTLLLGGVVMLVILVQITQSFGNYLISTKKLTSLWLVSALLVFACGIQVYSNHSTATNVNQITVGYITSPPQDAIMKLSKKIAKEKYNLDVKLVTFGDYNIPNRALNDNELQANVFQHIPFLEDQNKQFGYDIVPIGKTFLYPMGVFSKKYNKIDEIPNGATIAIPNDPTNQGRALMIMQDMGIIKLKDGITWQATPDSIASNPKKLKIIALQADQIPNNLGDVDVGIVNNDYIEKAGLTLKDALFVEPKDSPFANVIAVNKDQKNNPKLKEYVKALNNPQIKKVADKYYPNDAAIAAW
ncbi:MetQ/NlpA family ABC transporter substrate-binding protein [Francisella adeliensis]|uniref:MetQ/NlpA family lipoprotein n=1 Tax=Francisella adeliensis TaxID=2007306 RepID=A0A2Z4Y045_9GAMM|nr:MetQ/NlpA family ABC transporter substrate-binding protein [Francisella adeliensis]AXA34063.1 metal ABC transporter substrate-binding protein [Francisella adeliensis]MBK2085227.1 MetQ/NlpA family lipoprotein [Francisella adeliensis]MBK2096005.1 MetQ/NlpA family lipoprotein [Francisella adeliensis]QIW12302.1 MetQ/NlpA family lipoprotein [Francisella adeliensis]QIW14176.1 MetQ/NlpA family lipoprotein [Francisella adeliensis]